MLWRMQLLETVSACVRVVAGEGLAATEKLSRRSCERKNVGKWSPDIVCCALYPRGRFENSCKNVRCSLLLVLSWGSLKKFGLDDQETESVRQMPNLCRLSLSDFLLLKFERLCESKLREKIF